MQNEINEALRALRHYGPSAAHSFAGLIGWASIMVIPILAGAALNDGVKHSAKVEAPRFVAEARR